MKRILLLINLLEDSFFVASLFIIGFVIIDIVTPDKITLFRNILSIICHQRPIRCFFVLNQPMALCARCLGIYLGFAVFYKAVNRIKYRLCFYYFSVIYIVSDLVAELGLRLNVSNSVKFLFGLFFSFFIVQSLNLIRIFAISKMRQNEQFRERGLSEKVSIGREGII